MSVKSIVNSSLALGETLVVTGSVVVLAPAAIPIVGAGAAIGCAYGVYEEVSGVGKEKD